MIALASAVALAADPTGPEVLPGGERATRVELLDANFDQGLVAWRIETVGTHPCAYAGMDDPRAGVVLGLVRTGSAVESWAVYPAASDAAGCLGHAEAAARLAAAKARFAEVGLDIARKPAPGDAGAFQLKTVKLVDEADPFQARASTKLRWDGALVWTHDWTHANPRGSASKLEIEQVWIEGARAFVVLAHAWSHEGGEGRTLSGLVVDRPDP